MYVAGTRREEFREPPWVPIHAQSRAEIEFPRVRVPYSARCEFPATTPLRTAAHAQYVRRYRSAFGHRPLRTADRLPHIVDESPGTMHRLTLRA